MKKLTLLLAGIMMFAVAGTVVASDSHDAKDKQHASHHKQQPPISTGLSLYDANGQHLGSYVAEDTVVTRLASGYKILPFLNDGRIYPGGLAFLTNDCSGIPYIGIGDGRSYQRVMRVVDTLYYGKNMAPVVINPYSGKDPLTGVCYYLGGNSSDSAIEAVELTEKLPFNYPVAYPLTIQ